MEGNEGRVVGLKRGKGGRDIQGHLKGNYHFSLAPGEGLLRKRGGGERRMKLEGMGKEGVTKGEKDILR